MIDQPRMRRPLPPFHDTRLGDVAALAHAPNILLRAGLAAILCDYVEDYVHDVPGSVQQDDVAQVGVSDVVRVLGHTFLIPDEDNMATVCAVCAALLFDGAAEVVRENGKTGQPSTSVVRGLRALGRADRALVLALLTRAVPHMARAEMIEVVLDAVSLYVAWRLFREDFAAGEVNATVWPLLRVIRGALLARTDGPEGRQSWILSAAGLVMTLTRDLVDAGLLSSADWTDLALM